MGDIFLLERQYSCYVARPSHDATESDGISSGW